MLNYIWLGLMLLAVIIGGFTDHLKEVADKSFEMAEYAVMKTALPLVGIMALWLGMMRLAERAGLVALPSAASQTHRDRYELFVCPWRRTICSKLPERGSGS